jgi:hypothetical protein
MDPVTAITAAQAIAGLFGNKGGTGTVGDSGMTRYQFRDYNQTQPIAMQALYDLAMRAGVDPMKIGLPGTTPGATGGAEAAGYADFRNRWSPFAGSNGGSAIPALGGGSGGMYGGVYTTPEEQSIINEGFRQNAGTIEAAARSKIPQLIASGYSPQAAAEIAHAWATEQGSKARLSGEADLMHSAIGEQGRRLTELYGMSSGTAQQVSGSATQGALITANTQNQQQVGLWDAVAALAQSLGEKSGQTQGSTATPSYSPTGTSTWSAKPTTDGYRGIPWGDWSGR